MDGLGNIVCCTVWYRIYCPSAHGPEQRDIALIAKQKTECERLLAIADDASPVNLGCPDWHSVLAIFLWDALCMAGLRWTSSARHCHILNATISS
ncbi:MAG: hypothetical protein ACR5LD_05545 [Symbiopectobacterium sp.]